MKSTAVSVILVDKEDNELGFMEKMEAHQKGLLHRAFSVFIFNSKGELLLQQRADAKYHSAGLWTNTCCSHPVPGENVPEAASRRLMEEMGITAKLIPVFQFLYETKFENGLIEHEFDHVLFGISNEHPNINVFEVQNWKYINMETLAIELETKPQNYTAWLKLCFVSVNKYIRENQFQYIV